MTFSTADICDTHESLQILKPIMSSYGGKKSCQGSLCTIELDEDNKGLIDLLKQKAKENKIVVVDAKGKYCAIVGDTLMGIAKENGYEGIIVNGYVRDTAITKDIDVGLFALGVCPKKSTKKAPSKLNVPISFGGVDVRNDQYLYADCDGIVVLDTKILT